MKGRSSGSSLPVLSVAKPQALFRASSGSTDGNPRIRTRTTTAPQNSNSPPRTSVHRPRLLNRFTAQRPLDLFTGD